jgi:hypothetical protein
MDVAAVRWRCCPCPPATAPPPEIGIGAFWPCDASLPRLTGRETPAFGRSIVTWEAERGWWGMPMHQCDKNASSGLVHHGRTIHVNAPASQMTKSCARLASGIVSSAGHKQSHFLSLLGKDFISTTQDDISGLFHGAVRLIDRIRRDFGVILFIDLYKHILIHSDTNAISTFLRKPGVMLLRLCLGSIV